jgi:hypothetical protein
MALLGPACGIFATVLHILEKGLAGTGTYMHILGCCFSPVTILYQTLGHEGQITVHLLEILDD